MNASQQTLYDRILHFSFGDDSEELPFVRRLALENGWTRAYTLRVIDEYKRFAFMAVVADHPVTPSDQVDQAWHLHLTYTKSYWDHFCGQVLGTPLHHTPTCGGREESHKYNCWYRNTLESYSRFFGHEPPIDIWPDASVRFGHDLHYERINTKRNWIIPKPRFTRAAKNVGTGILLLVLFFLLAFTIKPLLADGDPWRNSRASTVVRSWAAQANDHASVLLFAQRRSAVDVIVGIFVVVSIVILVVAPSILRHRCTECKKLHALERTGAEEKGGWFKARRAEWKCKYCGHRTWRESSGGSSGCAAGCGDE